MAQMFIDEVHAQNVLQRMWEQTERKEFCDVTLIAGDTEEIQISAHRSVLSASSDYFKTMFTAPFKESTAKQVKLDGVDGETLKSLLKFCYSGRLEMREDTVEKLLSTADSLLLLPVVNACGSYLAKQLHPTNCLGMAQLAERHHCESLFEQAKDFSMKHFVELYRTDEFLNLSVEQLAQLLASDDLRDPTEEHVFMSLMIWLDHDRCERDKHRDELLKLVRLALIQPSFLIEQVQPFCTSFESFQLYIKATEWHLMPENRVNESNFGKPRKSDERLMAIRNRNNRLNILYHCPQRLKWMKWLENLDYRTNFGIAVMSDDLFIVGGYDGDTTVNTIICLNLKTMMMKDVSPMKQCRSNLGVAVINECLYAVGGHNGNHQTRSVEKWDSKSNIWTTVASMLVNRSCFGTTVFNGKLYVVGGLVYDIASSSVECYNPQENVWISMGWMCEERISPWLATVNGMLLAVGGRGKKSIERYNPITNQWTMIFNFNDNMLNRLCTTLDDKVVVIYKDRVDEYNTETNVWKVNTSITRLQNAYQAFSFSGSLLESNFVYS